MDNCLQSLHPILKKIAFTNERKIHQITLSIIQFSNLFNNAEAILHPSEIEQLNTYRYQKRRESYMYGRISGKMAISEHQNIPFHDFYITNGIFSHPVAEGKNIANCQVSLTHTDTASAAIAFNQAHPMGIDLEYICSDNADVVMNSFTPNEKELCRNEIYALAIWSAKEAVSKAIKLGLTIPLHFLEVSSISEINGIYTLNFSHFSQFRVTCCQVKDNIMAIAYPSALKLDMNTFPFSTQYKVETTCAYA